MSKKSLTLLALVTLLVVGVISVFSYCFVGGYYCVDGSYFDKEVKISGLFSLPYPVYRTPGFLVNEHFDLSPDDKSIVFAQVDHYGSAINIYESKIDGTGARPLTQFTTGENLRPVYHPSGQKIFFIRPTRFPDTNDVASDLYSINRDGGGIQRLTNNPNGYIITEVVVDSVRNRLLYLVAKKYFLRSGFDSIAWVPTDFEFYQLDLNTLASTQKSSVSSNKLSKLAIDQMGTKLLVGHTRTEGGVWWLVTDKGELFDLDDYFGSKFSPAFVSFYQNRGIGFTDFDVDKKEDTLYLLERDPSGGTRTKLLYEQSGLSLDNIKFFHLTPSALLLHRSNRFETIDLPAI